MVIRSRGPEAISKRPKGTRPTRLLALAALGAFSVTLHGCGESGSTTPTTSPPTFVIADAVVSENAGNMIFTVALSAPSPQDIMVNYATADATAHAGSDYLATNGTLIIPASQTAGSIAVTIVDDAVPEAISTFNVVLSGAINSTLADTLAVGTIVDDDGPLPALSITGMTASEGAGSVNFSVLRSGSHSSAVEVDFAAADGSAHAGSDYVAASGTLTIPAGQISGNIAVPIVDDAVPEATETLFVTLSNPVDATIGAGTATATIVDDDGPLPALGIADVFISEGGGSMNFSVLRSGSNSGAVEVDFATADGSALAGSDYVATSGTLTIPAGQSSGNISVPLINDAAPEPLETMFVSLSGAVDATIVDSTAAGTIVDDD